MINFRIGAEWIKLRRKVHYFTIFVIVNKILITKNRRILVFNNFLLKYYQLYRKIASDKGCLFSSHRVLRIFSEFFNTAFFHVGKIVGKRKAIRKCSTKS